MKIKIIYVVLIALYIFIQPRYLSVRVTPADRSITFEEKLEKVIELYGYENVYDLPGVRKYELKDATESDLIKFAIADKANVSFSLQNVSDLNNDYGVKIKGSKLKDIIVQTYPKNWVESRVSNIIQSRSQHGTCQSTDGTSSFVWAVCSDNSAGLSDIIFYDVSYRACMNDNIQHCFSHELGHANDWRNNNSLSFEERIDLLYSICERLNSDDRFHSEYVETRFTFDRKAIEYWAEICASYFNNQLFVQLNTKDVEIIEQIIIKDDPEFDAMASYIKRLMFLQYYPLPKYFSRNEYELVHWSGSKLTEPDLTRADLMSIRASKDLMRKSWMAKQ